MLFIDHGLGKGMYTFVVSNPDGKQVYKTESYSQENVVTEDLSRLPEGFYILMFKHENNPEKYIWKYILIR